MTKPGNARNCQVCGKQIKVRLIQYGRGGRGREGHVSSFSCSDEGVLLGSKWVCKACWEDFLPAYLKALNIMPKSVSKRSRAIPGRNYAKA